MIAAFEALRDEFRIFGMEGISLVLVCAALLFCIVEKEHLGVGTRKFTRYTILFFILLANPFGYNIIQSFWMKEYWKIFMVLLPMILIAIPMTELITTQKNIWKGALMAVCCAGIIVSSSFFDFDAERIGTIKEAYQTKKEVAAVDEVIRAAEIVPENMIAPREVCTWLREINPSAKLLYGEELIDQMIDKTAVSEDEEEQKFLEVCNTIVAVPSAVEHQITVANMYGSNCILLENSYDDMDLMEDAGFWCSGRTDKYTVYFRK